MATFRFRLATVRRLREVARDERRAALAEAYQAQDTIESRIAGIERQLAEHLVAVRQATAERSVNVDRLIDGNRHEMLLRAECEQFVRQRELLAGEIERRRELLALADREVRVLDKLQEKQSARFAADEARREGRRLDEFAIQRTGLAEHESWAD